jgi:hypothetical protein
MNFKEIFDKGNILCGTIYQMHLQRTVKVDDFQPGQLLETAKGFRVNLRSKQYGLYVPMEFETNKAELRVTVKTSAIVEQYGSLFRLMELELLPDLLQSTTGQEGYYMLPVMSGVTVDFRDRPSTINRDRIYMEQPQWEKFSMMNCFAAVRDDQNTLGIVTSGDFFCYIVSEMNVNGRNRLYPAFGIRHNPSETLSHNDCQVLYKTCESDEYADLAISYRDWLINEKGIAPLKKRLKNNPVLDYSVNAMRVKIFMGMKYPFNPDGMGEMQTYTTFEQAEKILDEMKSSGIERAIITLVGWNLGGHDGAYPSRFPVEPALGGEPGLKRLIEKAKQLDYQIVPHDNVTDIYRSAKDYDPEYVARTENGEPLPAGIWGGGQSFKACPLVYPWRWGREFERIQQLGFTGHYYMDAQSTVLWRCHDPLHPADEQEFALALAAITQIPRENFGAVSVEVPSAYSLPFIDEASRVHSCAGGYDCLLNKNLETLHALKPHGIPFFHIALHGLITYQDHWVHCYANMPGGIEYGLLRELAFGSRPSMEISWLPSPNSDFYKNSLQMTAKAYDDAFNTLNGVHVELIRKFEEPVKGVYITEYEDGTSVEVNLTDKEYNGLAPLSRRIKR